MYVHTSSSFNNLECNPKLHEHVTVTFLVLIDRKTISGLHVFLIHVHTLALSKLHVQICNPKQLFYDNKVKVI